MDYHVLIRRRSTSLQRTEVTDLTIAIQLMSCFKDIVVVVVVVVRTKRSDAIG